MTVIAFGRKKISTQKIKKQLFFQDMFYPLKTHAHYFTLLIYLATWGAAKLGIFTHFMFTNLPRRSQSISSLLHRFPAAFLALDHSRDRTSLHYRRPNKNFVLSPEVTNWAAMQKLYIKYLHTPNNKHFLYKNLFNITFALYNILKLRAYLFGLMNKDTCDSTVLETEKLLVLYPLTTRSRSLGSWVTARFIKSLRLEVLHLWHPQRNDQYFSPPTSVCKNEQ